MKMIVVVDQKWGIGADGDLLTALPEDMAFFRKKTEGHCLIMGRKTLESFPGKKPLKNRVNIVITRDKTLQIDGCEMVHSIGAALALYEAKYSHLEGFVVGGGSVYRQMLEYCDTAYITKIDKTFDHAQVFIHNLDERDNWTVTQESEIKTHEDLTFRFVTYKNGAVRSPEKDSLQYGGCEGQWNKE